MIWAPFVIAGGTVAVLAGIWLADRWRQARRRPTPSISPEEAARRREQFRGFMDELLVKLTPAEPIDQERADRWVAAMKAMPHDASYDYD